MIAWLLILGGTVLVISALLTGEFYSAKGLYGARGSRRVSPVLGRTVCIVAGIGVITIGVLMLVQ